MSLKRTMQQYIQHDGLNYAGVKKNKKKKQMSSMECVSIDKLVGTVMSSNYLNKHL